MREPAEKTFTSMVTKLEDNQIFLFGSNEQGRHGKGAAKYARDKFGAIYGQARGGQGRSYAIVTKDLTKKVHPSRTVKEIEDEISDFYAYADEHPELEFLVSYTAEGTNLNAYTAEEMADMFAQENIPSNVIFEKGFRYLVCNWCNSNTCYSRGPKNKVD